jgi:hypothetical protein
MVVGKVVGWGCDVSGVLVVVVENVVVPGCIVVVLVGIVVVG